MILYYPCGASEGMGPTGVLPGGQYFQADPCAPQAQRICAKAEWAETLAGSCSRRWARHSAAPWACTSGCSRRRPTRARRCLYISIPGIGGPSGCWKSTTATRADVRNPALVRSATVFVTSHFRMTSVVHSDGQVSVLRALRPARAELGSRPFQPRLHNPIRECRRAGDDESDLGGLLGVDEGGAVAGADGAGGCRGVGVSHRTMKLLMMSRLEPS